MARLIRPAAPKSACNGADSEPYGLAGGLAANPRPLTPEERVGNGRREGWGRAPFLVALSASLVLMPGFPLLDGSGRPVDSSGASPTNVSTQIAETPATSSSAAPESTPIVTPGSVPTWNNLCATGTFTGKCAPQPPSLQGGQLVYDAKDGYAIYFGGSTVLGSGFRNYTWKYTGSDGIIGTATWTNLSSSLGNTIPTHETNASLVYAAGYGSGAVLLIGGYTGTNTFSTQFWEFAGGAWTSLTAFPGTGRAGACAIAVPSISGHDPYILFFGGDTSKGTTHLPVALSDTWEFDETTSTWTNVTTLVSTPPSARTLTSCTWDAADGYGLLFGGVTQASTLLDDTWAFEPGLGTVGEWVQIIANGAPQPNPQASQRRGMSYVTSAGEVVLAGGAYGTLASPYPTNGGTNSTWTYLAGVWTNVTSTELAITAGVPTPTTARGGEAFADMPSWGYALLFSGQVTSSYNNASYAIGMPPAVYIEHNLGEIVLGQSVTFYANASGGGSSSYHYTWVDLPTGCTAGDVDVVTCTPTAVGDYVFTRTVAYSDAISNATVHAATLRVDPVEAVTNYLRPGPLVGTENQLEFWAVRLGGTGLTNGYGNGVGVTYNNLTGNQTLINWFRATGLHWIRFGGGDDSTNITADCDYSSSGVCGPPTENFTAYLKFCQAVNCDPVWGLPSETNDAGLAAITARYIENLENSLNIHPAQQLFAFGNEPNGWKHFNRPFASWEPTDDYTATPAQYALLEQNFSAAILATVDPHAKFMWGEIGGGETTVGSWFGGITGAIGAQVQNVAFHIYPAATGASTDVVTAAFLGQAGVSLINQSVIYQRQQILAACPACTDTQVSLGEANSGSGSPLYYTGFMLGYPNVPFIASELAQVLALNVSQFTFFDFANFYPWSLVMNGTLTPDYYLYADVLSHLQLGNVYASQVTPIWGANGVYSNPEMIRGVYTVRDTENGATYYLLVNTNTSVTDDIVTNLTATFGGTLWIDAPSGINVHAFATGQNVTTIALGPMDVALLELPPYDPPPLPVGGSAGSDVGAIIVGGGAATLAATGVLGYATRRRNHG